MQHTQQKVSKLVSFLIVLKLIEVVFSIFVSNTININVTSTFINAGVFILLSFFILKGYKGPLYFWILCSILSILSIFFILPQFGTQLIISVFIIGNIIFSLCYFITIFYLLTNKELTAYFKKSTTYK